MISEVITWKMTKEERLAYIKKYPIKPVKAKGKKDFKWRGKKGAASNSRWGAVGYKE